jgi:hypothetical protein
LIWPCFGLEKRLHNIPIASCAVESAAHLAGIALALAGTRSRSKIRSCHLHTVLHTASKTVTDAYDPA